MPNLFLALIASLFLFACSPGYSGIAPVLGPKDTAESNLGERLFREPRFAKFFVEQSHGDPNSHSVIADPVLAQSVSKRRGVLTGAFSGQAMSCVACHMVGDADALRHEGPRGYTDFAARSAIPKLDADDLVSTPRNTPTLLNAFIDRPPGVPFLLHFDGEFSSIEDLIIGSYTGRNFGWRPGESQMAKENIVRVIREDDGNNSLGQRFGGVNYREMFRGQSSQIQKGFRIGEDYRFDMDSASDDQVLSQVVKLIKVYLQALQFSTDLAGNFNGSAYDHFLLANHLPTQPGDGESSLDYAARLSFGLSRLAHPNFIEDDSGKFGELELEGAKIFFARSTLPSPDRGAGFFQTGNCVACHAPPYFTDFKFHNTGESQNEYDSIHGVGSFMRLEIPTLAERLAKPNAYLPQTDSHPSARGPFRRIPERDESEFADLGAWNIFLNPDYPSSQTGLSQIFCGGSCTDAEAALQRAQATFKTPGIRGTSLSDPYLHSGRKNTIQEVVEFYQAMSPLNRAGALRNGDPELSAIHIDPSGVSPLVAFINALNEDYE